MAGPTARIRWEDTTSPIDALASRGFAGKLERRSFIIYKPEFDGGQHRLLCLIGDKEGESLRADDPDELKAEAERWLAGFISSLGAVFPDEPGTMLADVDDEDVSEEEFRARYAPGRRVCFAHPDAGYLSDREMAFRLLTPGEVYTIEWSDIGFSSSRLGLAGIKSHGQGFNSVLFEPVDDEMAAPAAGEETVR